MRSQSDLRGMAVGVEAEGSKRGMTQDCEVHVKIDGKVGLRAGESWKGLNIQRVSSRTSECNQQSDGCQLCS